MSGDIDIFGDDSSIDIPITKEQHQFNEAIESITDKDGYFLGRNGEVVNGYQLEKKVGQGTFGTVYLAKKITTTTKEEEVALKIIRKNERMVKLSQKEAQLVKEVMSLKGIYIVQLITEFMYKDHYCIVLEKMDMSLRELLSHKPNEEGIDIFHIQRYGKQLFEALHVLHTKCEIYHCDIKPDNILIDLHSDTIKLADFGTALHPYELTIDSELGSRYYRPPEVMVGYPFDGSFDNWSSGVTLYELFTHSFLFTGESNNDMLYQIIQLKGSFPQKMIREGKFSSNHFTQDFKFIHYETDVFGKELARRISYSQQPIRISSKLIHSLKESNEHLSLIYIFAQLLEKLLVIDPTKRFNSIQAINHTFFTQTKE
ncbi:protein kinase putative [Entamoeba histolytica]|uniref:Protein kinase putative n=2 Tax=Entamoeba histolytica TaxID=5759 RepID=A0A175JJK3_ENTHI|nr:serine/threonine protein kinase prp4, putative [Entamoeba histolytica HM-1:IMSS-A]GAT93593.1 protein kinase putative [Entamoeba histolytica]